MKKITIVGTSVYGIENMGDEALLSVLVRELHKNIPDLEVTWLARHPDPTLAKLYNIQKVSKNFEHDSKKESIGRWFRGLNPNDPSSTLQEMRKILEETDLLIIGGDPFSEISLGLYRGLAPQAALFITLAKFLQKPTMLYAIHMGRKLETAQGQELTRFCITNATKVTLREAFSENVLKDMKISSENCVVLSDGAWGLDPMTKGNETAKRVLEEEGITLLQGHPVIGFNFRHEYWHWDDATWARYRDELAATCDHIVEAIGAEILFIPNCTYDLDHLYEDDRPVHCEIVKKMKHKAHAHQIVKKHNLFETLSLFPDLDMHFSNRRHSLVFAAVHRVPPIACGGTWHVKPAMDELGVGDKFVDIQKLDRNSMIHSFESTWQDREKIRMNLTKVLPALRRLALDHAKVAERLMNARK